MPHKNSTLQTERFHPSTPPSTGPNTQHEVSSRKGRGSLPLKPLASTVGIRYNMAIRTQQTSSEGRRNPLDHKHNGRQVPGHNHTGISR